MDSVDLNDFDHRIKFISKDSLLKDDPLSYGRSGNASELANQLKKRTFALSVNIVNLLDSTPESPSIKVIRY